MLSWPPESRIWRSNVHNSRLDEGSMPLVGSSRNATGESPILRDEVLNEAKHQSTTSLNLQKLLAHRVPGFDFILCSCMETSPGSKQLQPKAFASGRPIACHMDDRILPEASSVSPCFWVIQHTHICLMKYHEVSQTHFYI